LQICLQEQQPQQQLQQHQLLGRSQLQHLVPGHGRSVSSSSSSSSISQLTGNARTAAGCSSGSGSVRCFSSSSAAAAAAAATASSAQQHMMLEELRKALEADESQVWPTGFEICNKVA
jgi:hypothetical protein